MVTDEQKAELKRKCEDVKALRREYTKAEAKEQQRACDEALVHYAEEAYAAEEETRG